MDECSHFDLLIREFLSVFTRKRMIKVIEECCKNDEIEYKIDYLLRYLEHKALPKNENERKKRDSIYECIREYYRYQKLGVLTFRVKYECKIVILVEMVKRNYL